MLGDQDGKWYAPSCETQWSDAATENAIRAAVEAERERCARMVMAAEPWIGGEWAAEIAKEIRSGSPA